MILGYADSEHLKLTKREIIFADFQSVIRVPQRYKQTDDLPLQYHGLRSIAR